MAPFVMLLLEMGLITPLYSHPGGPKSCGDSQWFFHEDCGIQGVPTGLLWPLLWCLVVDGLKARLRRDEIHIQGYAMTLVFLW